MEEFAKKMKLKARELGVNTSDLILATIANELAKLGETQQHLLEVQEDLLILAKQPPMFVVPEQERPLVMMP